MLKTYDPKKFRISFAGINLNKGIAPGTFLVVSSVSPGFSSEAGADGEVVRTRSHDRRATARLTLMQTSEVNDRLSSTYAADRAATNGQGVGAFSVKDDSAGGTTIGEASKAWISDDPDLQLEAEAGTREWVFELADWRPTHGSVSND